MGRIEPSNSTIIGVALVLFGSVLLGVGMHHVVATGTCSSTGYSSNLGPVPHCPAGTGWWIMFIVVGILLGVFGGILSGGSSAALIVPAIFTGIGVGALSVAFDQNVHSSTKTFAAVFGGAFAFFGIVPALIIGGSSLLRSGGSSGRNRQSAFGTPAGSDAIMSAYAEVPRTPAPATTTFTPGSVATFQPSSPAVSAAKASGDALDKIAKLAKLREQGALTNEEFNREKAKLLSEL
ncbi:MAG: SHOCT domain-containing protein [Solirubrobacteraceae bacterium]